MNMYFIKNDWDHRTLSRSMTWVNDYRDSFDSRYEAEGFVEHYLNLNPIDLGRLRIEEIEVQDV